MIDVQTALEIIDGIIREMTFTEPVSLSVLSQHRRMPPYGLSGGNHGQCGIQKIIGKNGSEKN